MYYVSIKINNMKNKTELSIITERNLHGDKLPLHARMPLFHKDGPDLKPNEVMVLTWLMISQFTNYKRMRVVTNYTEMASILGTTRLTIKRAVEGLEEKKLLYIDREEKEYTFAHRINIPDKDYQMITKALLTTNIFDFKTKGFIASLLLVSNEYVIELGNISEVSEKVGMDRKTVKKHYKILKDLDYIVTTEVGLVLDLRSIFADTINAAVDRMITAESKVRKLEKKVGELAEIIKEFKHLKK